VPLFRLPSVAFSCRVERRRTTKAGMGTVCELATEDESVSHVVEEKKYVPKNQSVVCVCVCVMFYPNIPL